MRIIHWLLSSLILFVDWLTTPKGIQRDEEVQAEINEQTSVLTLYQYKACPFCVKVIRKVPELITFSQSNGIINSSARHKEVKIYCYNLKL